MILGFPESDPTKQFLTEQALAFPYVDLVEEDIRELPADHHPLPYSIEPERPGPLLPGEIAKIALRHVEQNQGEQ